MTNGSFLDIVEPSVRSQLESVMSITNYSRGSLVISQNDTSDDVFLVLEGRARATIYSAEGKTVSYRDIATGAIFGELAAIDRTPRSASVTAQENLRVGLISGKDFREWIEAHPDAMWAVLRYLTSQCRRMTERIFEFSTKVVRDRLVNELVRMAFAASDARNAAVISPAPTHFELASAISTHREAVSREMSRLAKQELVVKKTDGLHVPDIEALSLLQVKC